MDVLARDVTLAALAQSLTALNQRQTLIAQNIANANTPHYKRRDVAFSEELAQALGLSAGAKASPAPATRSAKVDQVMGTVAREVVEERLFFRPDMGGVDLDREMAEQAKTTMLYAALAQLAQERLTQYRTVIRDGRV